MNNLLKDKGLKSTKQRSLVLDIIYKLKDQSTINNICRKINNKMDKSTVYRIIDLFLEKDILEKEVNYNNETYFSIKEEHGHYFTCIKCHKKEKLSSCPLEEVEEELIDEKGYQVINHKVELIGICNKCNK